MQLIFILTIFINIKKNEFNRDASFNKLQSLPPSIGDLSELSEL